MTDGGDIRMIKSLRLQRFKNFRDATLRLGPLSVIVGTNASGKSNLRDAFRFLHGMSRGYSLAEILGEKYVEGGILQWKGIRGGTTPGSEHFAKRMSRPWKVGFVIGSYGLTALTDYFRGLGL
jgi:hypothetical protein